MVFELLISWMTASSLKISLLCHQNLSPPNLVFLQISVIKKSSLNNNKIYFIVSCIAFSNFNIFVCYFRPKFTPRLFKSFYFISLKHNSSKDSIFNKKICFLCLLAGPFNLPKSWSRSPMPIVPYSKCLVHA